MATQEGFARAPLLAAFSSPTTPADALLTSSFERRGVSIAVLQELLCRGQQWHSSRRVLLVRHDRLSAAPFTSKDAHF